MGGWDSQVRMALRLFFQAREEKMQQQSDFLGTISKARRYEDELWSIMSCESGWILSRNDNTYTIRTLDGRLQCDCRTRSPKPNEAESCQHTRVLESLGIGGSGEIVNPRLLGRAIVATLHGA